MKKSIFFASLLAGLLLVGCGQQPSTSENSNNSSDKPSSETVKPETPDVVEEFGDTALVGEKVGDYDLSEIFGQWSKVPEENTIYFGAKGESVDITSNFVNKVTGSTTALKSVMTGTEGVERSQKSQGAGIGGIKLNNKDGKAEKDSSLTFNLADNNSVDQIILEITTWPKTDGSTTDHKIKINDKVVEIPAGTSKSVKVGLAVDDMTTIKVTSLKGRPTITAVKFYNK